MTSKISRERDYLHILQISLFLCLSLSPSLSFSCSLTLRGQYYTFSIKWLPGTKRRLNVLKPTVEQTSFSLIIQHDQPHKDFLWWVIRKSGGRDWLWLVISQWVRARGLTVIGHLSVSQGEGADCYWPSLKKSGEGSDSGLIAGGCSLPLSVHISPSGLGWHTCVIPSFTA